MILLTRRFFILASSILLTAWTHGVNSVTPGQVALTADDGTTCWTADDGTTAWTND